MKLKMRSKVLSAIIGAACLAAPVEGWSAPAEELAAPVEGLSADTVPAMFSKPLEWRVGVQISPSWVPGTNSYVRGKNPDNAKVNSSFGGDLRADFSFNPATREGMLYPGLYQGIGLGVNGYFHSGLLGTPVSAYVYQGAPIVNLSERLSLDYEWQFGASFGWKHYNKETAEDNVAIGSPVTAHLGLAVKLNYQLSSRWALSLGIGANHYSNGNTSWPNGGINTVGASIGIAYIINPQGGFGDELQGGLEGEGLRGYRKTQRVLAEEADRHKWMYDIMAYGAWRKRVVTVGYPAEPTLCPGRFGVLGMQFSPLYKLNRWASVGPALDIQWDESSGLEPYWVEGSYNENIKFKRPPFGKQLSLGFSAHAELTMPIFSVNVGLGYDVLNPKGDKAFYQSLTLKTFITKNIYLNTGYRLGNFHDPQNLMLGVGLRL